MPYPGKIASKTLTTASKYYATFGGRASDEFRTSHYGIQTIKMGFNHF